MDKILKIQSEIGALSKTETNPFFKSKYFDINSLIAQLMPLLEKYGLTVTQPLSTVAAVGRDGFGTETKPAILTQVYDGEKLLVSEKIQLPENSNPQQMGSAITYYRRYALQSLFLLQAEDDDANHASSSKPSVKASQPSTETKKDEDINLEDIPF